MDFLENENVCSVKKEDSSDYYRIHTLWEKDRFRINIASKNGAWTGEMTPENIKTFSSNLQTDENKYLAECKEALTADDGKQGYSYIVENGSFNWKKMIDEDTGMKLKMGSVLLQPANFPETLQNIVEVSLKYKKSLKQQVDELLKNKQTDMKRVIDLQMKLEELINKKTIMEDDLYCKFLLLLNTKKRKIEELKESLDNLQKKTKFAKNTEECENSGNCSNPHTLHPYDMDTEDDDDDDDDIASEELKISTVEHKINQVYKKKGVTRTKDKIRKTISETDLSAESEESNPVPHYGVNIDKCNVTYGKTSGDSISAHTHGSTSTVNFENTNKLPATKDGILDFFFGSKSQG